MGDGGGRAAGPGHPGLARAGVVLLVVSAVGLGVTVARHYVPDSVALPEVHYLLLAVTAGCFLTAGMYRIAKWRLVRDSHSGLMGSALVVVGLLAVPAPVLAVLLAPDRDATLVGAGTHLVASLIAFLLVLQALSVPRPGAGSTPARLVPAAFSAFGAVLGATVILEWVLPAPHALGRASTDLVVYVMAASGWISVALLAARQGRYLPWAARVAPLLGGMAVAELLRGMAAVRDEWWGIAGLLVALAIAALAARTALRDLDDAIGASQADRDRLHKHVEEAASELARLSDWRSQVRHDARNTCAGLRATMEMLGDSHPGVVATAHSLRRAAVSELWRLEQLLTTTDDEQPMTTFQLLDVVESLVSPSRALGREVLVSGYGAFVVGRPEEVSLALNELLFHAGLSDPSARIGIDARVIGGNAHLTVTTDRPGALPSPDSSELQAARVFVRRQGGELVGTEAHPGSACYVVRLRTQTMEVA